MSKETVYSGEENSPATPARCATRDLPMMILALYQLSHPGPTKKLTLACLSTEMETKDSRSGSWNVADEMMRSCLAICKQQLKNIPLPLDKQVKQ